MNKQVPLTITFLTGIIMIVAFFIPHQPFGNLQDTSLQWYAIIFGFTLLLGVQSLLSLHWRKIKRKQAGWWYSIVLIIGLLLAFVTGIQSEIVKGSAFEKGSTFMYMYNYVLLPLQSTMFAMLAFFIASAAYRAFRARNIEASLLLIAAVIVMLGRVPAGTMLWKGFPGFTSWILNVVQLGPMRGIQIGIALGTIAMSLRLILGIERTYLS